MLHVFEVFVAQGHDPDSLLSKETLEETRAQVMTWAEAWSARVIQYAPAFWTDLARDHPALWARLQRDLDERKAKGAALLLPYLRPGLVPAAAFGLLDLIYTHSHDPRRCDRQGVARRDAIRTALSIWAEGALVQPPRRRR